MQYIYKYSSPLGGITAASNGTALTGLWFDGQKYFAGNLSAEHEERDLPVFQKTKLWLELYFSKKVPDFTPPLSTAASPFRLRVWEILRSIPYGQTMTYGEIARSRKKRGNGYRRRPSAARWATTLFPLSFPATESSEAAEALRAMREDSIKKSSFYAWKG